MWNGKIHLKGENAMHKELKGFNSFDRTSNKAKWYERSWIIILSLILIYPVGLSLMWAFKKWKLWLRIVITIIFLLIYFVNIGDNNETETKTVHKESKSEKDLKEELKIAKAENEDLKSSIEDMKNTKEVTKTEKSTEEEPTKEASEEATKEEATTEKSLAKKESKKSNREEKAALGSAETYSKTLHMSKQGIYDQLISQAGDKYPEEAAQYAVDNLKADYKENALKSAKNYIEIMDMSDDELYQQLTSSAGDKFTPEEAQYALDNLE